MGRDTVFLKVESRLGYDFSGDIKIGGKYTSLIEHAGLVFISGQISKSGRYGTDLWKSWIRC